MQISVSDFNKKSSSLQLSLVIYFCYWYQCVSFRVTLSLPLSLPLFVIYKTSSVSTNYGVITTSAAITTSTISMTSAITSVTTSAATTTTMTHYKRKFFLRCFAAQTPSSLALIDYWNFVQRNTRIELNISDGYKLGNTNTTLINRFLDVKKRYLL